MADTPDHSDLPTVSYHSESDAKPEAAARPPREKAHECGRNDMPSCPRSSPQQLTRAEVETIKEMVTGEDYRHVPTGTLAVLAQRLGKVFA